MVALWSVEKIVSGAGVAFVFYDTKTIGTNKTFDQDPTLSDVRQI